MSETQANNNTQFYSILGDNFELQDFSDNDFVKLYSKPPLKSVDKRYEFNENVQTTFVLASSDSLYQLRFNKLVGYFVEEKPDQFAGEDVAYFIERFSEGLIRRYDYDLDEYTDPDVESDLDVFELLQDTFGEDKANDILEDLGIDGFIDGDDRGGLVWVVILKSTLENSTNVFKTEAVEHPLDDNAFLTAKFFNHPTPMTEEEVAEELFDEALFRVRAVSARYDTDEEYLVFDSDLLTFIQTRTSFMLEFHQVYKTSQIKFQYHED